MKTFLYTLAFLLLVTGCDQSAVAPQSDRIARVDSEQASAAVDVLSDFGFDVSDVIVQSDGLVVEQDVYMPFDQIFELRDSGGKNLTDKQWSTTNLVSKSKVNDIKIRIDSKVPSAWKTAARNAMTQWNDIQNSSVTMYEVSSGEDILIRYARLSSPFAIAQATFPSSNGDAGPRITINRANFNLSTSQELFTMVHELGHCIGFRHTNWFDRNSDGEITTNDSEGVGSVGAVHIDGTPEGLDSNSVMNAYVASWKGFSHYDEIAAVTLYDGPNGTGGGDGGGGGDPGTGGTPGNGNGHGPGGKK